MISDAQITMLRLLSKDVAIAVDRAVKTRMQEQRISQGQLLLQVTRATGNHSDADAAAHS